MIMRKSKPASSHRIALALAGGGPMGAIYEIGALCALEDALTGINFTQLNHYVGVSAGGFIAASMANGLTPRKLCGSFIENNSPASDVFDPAWLMMPAYDEFARRAIMLPGLMMAAFWELAVKRKSITHALERFSPGLPTGIFSNEEIHRRLSAQFSLPGRTNDFRQLKTKLTLVATHLDSGESAPFGQPGWDHVPISRAVQASSALPGLFPPVEIDDKYYVDGALKKTMHASVALDDGMDLVICLNPIVPFDASIDDSRVQSRRIPKIIDGGLPSVLSQTFRSMIHSRMELGMKHYEKAYPHTDIVLIEPDRRDAELYLANTFSYSNRRHLAEHAYQQTMSLLRSGTLTEKLARHGVHLRAGVLADHKRVLLDQAAYTPRTRLGRAVHELHAVLDDLQACSPSLIPAGLGLGYSQANMTR
ncbi:MAG: patatin-like phospholipase family protein [Betaproteobacteria bacterium]|jgi:NTE family protein|nr:patatin-like phospholipase family protein [Betaproteobacteria bacterium]MBP6645918.1 patatin-like phospholipase family protein [Burkholderiaceae bacterium]